MVVEVGLDEVDCDWFWLVVLYCEIEVVYVLVEVFYGFDMVELFEVDQYFNSFDFVSCFVVVYFN